MEAATVVIVERGYAAATIDEIAAHASTSRATFYLHFADKAAVVAALADDARADIPTYYQALDDALFSEDREQLREWLRQKLLWFREHHHLTLLVDDVLARSDDPAIFAVELHKHMPNLLEHWAGDPETARIRTWLLVMFIARTYTMIPALEVDGVVEEDAIVDLLEDVFRAGLLTNRTSTTPLTTSRT
jgi:AcrR family transcriptional regulator